MDYEKAYKEALKRVRAKYAMKDQPTHQDLVDIFPELKESENEKMIQYFKDLAPFDKAEELYEKYGFSHKDAIAWLEKQGEQKADKVEPKFREGDWVVYCNDDVDLITGIEENGYCINNSGYIPFICASDVRLWTIEDAKDGDVLVSESNCGLGTWYCIFKSLDDDESMTVYCYLARDGRFETKKELCFDKDPFNTKPATKEQRDLLFQKMHEAGYEWDAEKKELKEIEQKPAWSEEDEHMFNTIANSLNREKVERVWNTTEEEVDNWLKSIKDRYTWKPNNEHYELEEFAKIVRGNLTGISKAVQKLFEAKYLQLTGNKMYRGFKD